MIFLAEHIENIQNNNGDDVMSRSPDLGNRSLRPVPDSYFRPNVVHYRLEIKMFRRLKLKTELKPGSHNRILKNVRKILKSGCLTH